MDIHSPQQSLTELITTFRSVGDELRMAIEQDNIELVEQLDHRISAQFDALFDFTPMNVEDALEFIEFLLEHLVPHGAATTLAEQTKAKIMSVAAIGFEIKSSDFDE